MSSDAEALGGHAQPMTNTLMRWLFCVTISLSLITGCGTSDVGESENSDPGAEIVEDFTSGDQDDATQPSDEIAEFEGLVTIIVDGRTFEFEAPDCQPTMVDKIGNNTDFSAIGTGQIDGEPFGGFVTRLIQDLDGDGTDNVLHTIRIEGGRSDTLQQADPDQPSLIVQLAEGDPGDLDVAYEPGRMSGSGTLIDRNGVLAPSSEEVSFTFVATCV